MKYLCKIFFILFTIPIVISAQQEQLNNPKSKSDSLKNKIELNPLSKIYYKFEEFEFYRQMNEVNNQVRIDEDSATKWLRMSYNLSHTNLSENLEFEQNFLSPLYKKYMQDSDINIFRYILGIAQYSAAGYLAYRHIKKYGFFNKGD